MRYGEPFEHVECELLEHIPEDAFLCIESFLVNAYEATIWWCHKSLQYLFLGGGQGTEQLLLAKVLRGRAVVAVCLPAIHKGLAAHCLRGGRYLRGVRLVLHLPGHVIIALDNNHFLGFARALVSDGFVFLIVCYKNTHHISIIIINQKNRQTEIYYQ